MGGCVGIPQTNLIGVLKGMPLHTSGHILVPEVCALQNGLWDERVQESTLKRQVYSDYLQSLQWDYFITVTFKRPFRDSIKAHQYVWDTLQTCNTKRAFLAVERHRYPNWNCHVHGLVSDYTGEYTPNQLLPWEIWERLYSRFGRTTVSAINSQKAVADYCSKYVVKRMSDYGFYGAPTFWEK